MLLTIILILSTNLFAATPDLQKGSLDLTIGEERYRHHISPLLSSVINQYYSFIADSSPEFGKDLKDLQVISVRIALEWKERSSPCKKNPNTCDLANLYKEANKLDQGILSLQEKFWVHIKPKYDADTLIKVSKYLDEVMIINYRLLHKIEEIHVLSNNFNKPKVSSFDEIALIQRDQENNIINLFFNILPENLKLDFSNLYYSFVKPLEHQGDANNAGAIFTARIHDYNIALNTFHMNLTKGDLPLSREQIINLNNIHQTWNGMLRSLL